MAEGSASIVVKADPTVVWNEIADITRMGDWSPECTAGRWVDPATGPAVGAFFDGDNEANVAGITVKRWTTRSEVTACEAGKVFEFAVEHYTTWRYDLEPTDGGTRVTESFSYASEPSMQTFLYESVLRRPKAMVKGMHHTLGRLKVAVEATSPST